MSVVLREDVNVPDPRPVLAAQTIANIVKSSLGPMGLDKMLVDNIGVRDAFPLHIHAIMTLRRFRK